MRDYRPEGAEGVLEKNTHGRISVAQGVMNQVLGLVRAGPVRAT